VDNESAWTFVRDEVSRYHALLLDEAAQAASDQARATVEGNIAVLELIRSDIEAASTGSQAGRQAERLSA
jgi:hypothetical protein